jgi:hypothetical protein
VIYNQKEERKKKKKKRKRKKKSKTPLLNTRVAIFLNA